MSNLIIIGIPSWNEAETIRDVTAMIDCAARARLDPAQCLLVNADNRSTDGTSDLFMQTPTVIRKKVLLSEAGKRGKGRNFRQLFELMIALDARALVTLDADLDAVPVDWIPALLHPIDAGETDMAIPLYPRFWYDGNLTNQIIAPLIAGVTGVPIRQPIAGEFAFGREFVTSLLREDWTEDVEHFGIDIFCVLCALRRPDRIVQTPMSHGKVHSWRSDTAEEVETEMAYKFDTLVRTALLGLAKLDVSAIPAAVLPLRFPKVPCLSADPKDYTTDHLKEAAQLAMTRLVSRSDFVRLAPFLPPPPMVPAMSDDQWAAVLVNADRETKAGRLTDGLLEVLRALFLSRISVVLPVLTDDEVEPMVERLANSVHSIIFE